MTTGILRGSPRTRRLLRGGLLVLGVLLVVTVIMIAVGASPLQALGALVQGAFGTPRNIGESVVRAAPLIVIAITLLPSLRAGLFNLGAPGQMGVGALFATIATLALAEAPTVVMVAAAVAAATIGGIAAAAIPALMKARFQINEIITTISMNFLVVFLLTYLLNGALRGEAANRPQSDILPEGHAIPVLIPGTRAHWGILLAVLLVAAVWLIDRTRTGYRMRLFGANPSLARQAGISSARYVFALMCLAGAGAGLAGWMQIAGVDHRLYATVADPVGYTGLFVALLGGLHPIGVLIAGVLMGALLQGGQALQLGAGIQPEIVQVLLGLVLIAYAIRPSRKGA